MSKKPNGLFASPLYNNGSSRPREVYCFFDGVAKRKIVMNTGILFLFANYHKVRRFPGENNTFTDLNRSFDNSNL